MVTIKQLRIIDAFLRGLLGCSLSFSRLSLLHMVLMLPEDGASQLYNFANELTQ